MADISWATGTSPGGEDEAYAATLAELLLLDEPGTLDAVRQSLARFPFRRIGGASRVRALGRLSPTVALSAVSLLGGCNNVSADRARYSSWRRPITPVLRPVRYSLSRAVASPLG